MNFKAIVDEALKRGITEIEIFYQEITGEKVELYEAKVDNYEISHTHSIYARGIYNGQFGYVATEKIDDNINNVLIDGIIACATILTTKDKFFIYPGGDTYLEEKKANDYQPKQADIVNELKSIEKDIFAFDERIEKVELSFFKSLVKRNIFNSKGLDLMSTSSEIGLAGNLTASTKTDTRVGYNYISIDSFESLDRKGFISRMANKALEMLDAKKIPTDNYEIILNNEVASNFLELFLGLMNAKSIKQKLSALINRLNTRVGVDELTIYNDPNNRNFTYTRSFDDEGVPTRKRAVVEKGILKSYFYDLSTSDYYKVSPTGDGYKGKISAPAVPRFYNAYIEPGKKTQSEMIFSIKKGILVTSTQGMHAGFSSASGAFSFQGSGFYIEDGKILYPITLFVISGNILSLFENIEMIGNDLEFSPFESSLSPSIKVAGLTISGE